MSSSVYYTRSVDDVESHKHETAAAKPVTQATPATPEDNNKGDTKLGSDMMEFPRRVSSDVAPMQMDEFVYIYGRVSLQLDENGCFKKFCNRQRSCGFAKDNKCFFLHMARPQSTTEFLLTRMLLEEYFGLPTAFRVVEEENQYGQKYLNPSEKNESHAVRIFNKYKRAVTQGTMGIHDIADMLCMDNDRDGAFILMEQECLQRLAEASAVSRTACIEAKRISLEQRNKFLEDYRINEWVVPEDDAPTFFPGASASDERGDLLVTEGGSVSFAAAVKRKGASSPQGSVQSAWSMSAVAAEFPPLPSSKANASASVPASAPTPVSSSAPTTPARGFSPNTTKLEREESAAAHAAVASAVAVVDTPTASSASTSASTTSNGNGNGTSTKPVSPKREFTPQQQQQQTPAPHMTMPYYFHPLQVQHMQQMQAAQLAQVMQMAQQTPHSPQPQAPIPPTDQEVATQLLDDRDSVDMALIGVFDAMNRLGLQVDDKATRQKLAGYVSQLHRAIKGIHQVYADTCKELSSHE